MNLASAAHIAWKQLCYDRSKMIMAIFGVMFACVLVFMQLGFRDSLFASATILPRHLKGDLFITHTFTQAIWKGVPCVKQDIFRMYAHPRVNKITPMHIGQAQWKNPSTLQKEMILVIGCPPKTDTLSCTENALYVKNTACAMRGTEGLTLSRSLLFDTRSKKEFGPVDQFLKLKSPLFIEINDCRFEVIGTFALGTSFAASGNMVCSEQSFFTLFPKRQNKIDLAVIQLKEKSDILSVQREMRPKLSPSLQLLTYQELVEREENYWRTRTSIGFTFGMGVVIGLVVGMVIVYQILFTDVMNHIKEYATLRAIGYPQSYLRKIVLCAALWMAILGFFPGVLLSFLLYRLTQSITLLPMTLSLSTILWVGLFILSMCCFAGLLAARKVNKADPADLF